MAWTNARVVSFHPYSVWDDRVLMARRVGSAIVEFDYKRGDEFDELEELLFLRARDDSKLRAERDNKIGFVVETCDRGLQVLIVFSDWRCFIFLLK